MSQRILFITDSFHPVSQSLQLDLLTRNLARDYDVHIASLQHEELGFPTLLQRHNDPENEVKREYHFLGKQERGSHESLLQQVKLSLRLRKLIGQLRPRLVHTWCQPAERIALLACRRLKFEAPRVVSTELHVQPGKRLTLQMLDNRLSRISERMIVPHESVKQSLVENGYREPRITIAPNSMEPLPMNPRKARNDLLQLTKLDESTKLAGVVAPLQARSKLKDLVWATDLLTCIRDDFHLLVFGQGDQLWRLRKFASQTQAESHIHFLGLQNNLLDLVPGLDFFLQSHLNEPQSPLMMYAMQCGVPTVSVYGPGTNEVIRHQETGLAVNFGARDEFARWCKYMLELPESAKQLADQGQSFVRTAFPVEKMANVYREVYNVGF